MTRPTRTILRLTALLAAAAALNYAVAWACVLWSPDRPAQKVTIDDLAEQMGLPVQWDEPVGALNTSTFGFDALRSGWPVFQVPGVETPVQYRHLIDYGSPHGQLHIADIVTTKAGFPLRSLSHCTTALPPRWIPQTRAPAPGMMLPTFEVAQSLQLSTDDFKSRTGIPVVPHRRIPWTPLWSPFLLNTLFYAALLSTPTYIIPALKRRLRHSRGQCTTCGYTLSGLTTCPECATPAPAMPSVRPILACLAAALFSLPTLGCSQPLHAHMSEVEILNAAVREFPLGSSPDQVRLNCNRLDITLTSDRVVDNAMYGRLPTGLPRPFYAATPTATLKFSFDSTPALNGFGVSKGFIEPIEGNAP